MFKIGMEILNKDFNVQLGYNRRAKKNYSNMFVSNLSNTEVQEQKEELD